MTSIDDPIDFDLKMYWAPNELEEMVIKETTKTDNMAMKLIVKKPDYLGLSKWEFRHGSKSITASMNDKHWLVDFQSRKIDIRPGDALRCRVTLENSYGYDNELIRELYTVTKVEKILVDHTWNQISLLPDDPENKGKK